MITAALNGKLDDVDSETHDVFGLAMPTFCPGVPSQLLNPRDTWDGKDAYDAKANRLAEAFHRNFAKYADKADERIRKAAPAPAEKV